MKIADDARIMFAMRTQKGATPVVISRKFAKKLLKGSCVVRKGRMTLSNCRVLLLANGVSILVDWVSPWQEKQHPRHPSADDE